MKKIFKYSFISLATLMVAASLVLFISGKQYVFKALYYNFADIDDYKIFSNRIIAESSTPLKWKKSKNYNQVNISDSLKKTLEKIETVAFLIIKDDSIQYEQYWDGYSPDSYSNSFSMAKSYVGALIGIALQEGKIKNINQPVSDFLPEFKEGDKSKITIRHLLMMSSGLNWEEGYASPLSVTTEAYYGSDLRKLIRSLKPVEEPGKIFRYKSGDTQIISFILEKATGMSLSKYAHEKLWQPLGCTNDALWSLDKDGGNEKAYCCLNSNARDFAKIGKLYLQKGAWNHVQLISPVYIEAAITPTKLPDGDFDYKPADFYGYHWWTLPAYKGHDIFYARGILGQYVIVIPEKKIIIVRLGKKRGEKAGKHYQEIFTMIDEALSR